MSGVRRRGLDMMWLGHTEYYSIKFGIWIRKDSNSDEVVKF